MTAPRAAPPARFVAFAWGTLAFTIAVVLWGAYVRATGSGAGCGAHWPLCDGQVLPRAPRVETLIELTHRLTSGLSLLLVLGLAAWTRRLVPPGHRVRRAAAAAVLLILSEAAIGAGLVLFGLVADDRSPVRAVVFALHLANTFFLLAALALTARFAGTPSPTPLPWRRSPLLARALAVLAGMLVVGVSGAIAALGDTLYPATSLGHALAQDLSPGAHTLLRLRLHHPWIAVVVAVATVAFALAQQRRVRQDTGRLPSLVLGLTAAQLAAGAVNVLLLAPVWLQLVHLLLADLLWVTLVLLVAAALDADARPS
jgi:heme A synthase